MIHVWNIVNGVLNVHEERLAKHRILWTYYTNDKSEDRNESKEVFKYIDTICDSKGYVRLHGLTDNDAHNYAFRNCRLPEDFKQDALIRTMIDYVKENLEKDVIVDAIEIATKALNMSNKAIKSYTDALSNYMDEPLDKDGIPKDPRPILESIEKYSTLIPKQVKSLQALYKSHDEKTKILRGGGEFKESMDGDKHLDKILGS